jgi:hypothetical protein
LWFLQIDGTLLGILTLIDLPRLQIMISKTASWTFAMACDLEDRPKIDYQIAALAEMSTPNLQRKKKRLITDLLMEGLWKKCRFSAHEDSKLPGGEMHAFVRRSQPSGWPHSWQR